MAKRTPHCFTQVFDKLLRGFKSEEIAALNTMLLNILNIAEGHASNPTPDSDPKVHIQDTMPRARPATNEG